MGHVNNAVFFTYFAEGRLTIFRKLPMDSVFDMGNISAASNKPDRTDLEKEREERKSRLNEIKWF